MAYKSRVSVAKKKIGKKTFYYFLLTMEKISLFTPVYSLVKA
jgi:hypothetical protein